MNPTADLTRRIDVYLDAVERNLAHKPDAVRRDILAGLREHIAEALRREGDTPSPGAIERILGGMDAPMDPSTLKPGDPVPTGGPVRAGLGLGQRGGATARSSQCIRLSGARRGVCFRAGAGGRRTGGDGAAGVFSRGVLDPGGDVERGRACHGHDRACGRCTAAAHGMEDRHLGGAA
jgi:hypothetical protein